MIEREQIIARLRHFRPELEKKSIAHLALYGSVARGEQGLNSDLDILVDFFPDMPPIGLIEFAGLQNQLSDLLEMKVDLGMLRAIRKPSQKHILKDLVNVW